MNYKIGDSRLVTHRYRNTALLQGLISLCMFCINLAVKHFVMTIHSLIWRELRDRRWELGIGTIAVFVFVAVAQFPSLDYNWELGPEIKQPTDSTLDYICFWWIEFEKV